MNDFKKWITIITILFAAIQFTKMVAYAGDAPWISPSSEYVLGVNKTLEVYTGGGVSSQPDYDPSCPPWKLKADAMIWNWIIDGPGDKESDADTITLTATAVGEITIKVNRNDHYEDGADPPMEDIGVTSDDSNALTVHVLKLSIINPEKKWYYFGSLSNPFPLDLYQKEFRAEGDIGGAGSLTWEVSPNRAEMHDVYGIGGKGQHMMGTSNDAGDVAINAKWGNEEIGVINETIRNEGSITVPLWEG